MANPDKTTKQTLVAEGTELKGSLRSTWPVVVNGTIDGKVDAPELTITRAGAVLGAVKAKTLRSHGTLSGNVDAADVFLSGAVCSNTIIRATSLELKLGSPDRGGLELIFGESNIGVSETPASPSGLGDASSGGEGSSGPGAATIAGADDPSSNDDWAP
jgi:cytoskeletal protein CcmA (bactofilin family)